MHLACQNANGKVGHSARSKKTTANGKLDYKTTRNRDAVARVLEKDAKGSECWKRGRPCCYLVTHRNAHFLKDTKRKCGSEVDVYPNYSYSMKSSVLSKHLVLNFSLGSDNYATPWKYHLLYTYRLRCLASGIMLEQSKGLWAMKLTDPLFSLPVLL